MDARLFDCGMTSWLAYGQQGSFSIPNIKAAVFSLATRETFVPESEG